jgi:hypothetical protein
VKAAARTRYLPLPPEPGVNTPASEVTGTPATGGTCCFTARVTDSTGTVPGTPETITISS